jgi:hypothetical protein
MHFRFVLLHTYRAYNLGNVLREDPTKRGLVSYVELFT